MQVPNCIHHKKASDWCVRNFKSFGQNLYKYAAYVFGSPTKHGHKDTPIYAEIWSFGNLYAGDGMLGMLEFDINTENS